MPDADAPHAGRLSPIPSFLPGWQPHLLSGPSGVGKTAFTAWWVSHLRRSQPIFGKPTQAPPWLGLVLTDREQDDTLEWYRIAGCGDVPCYSAVNDATFDFFDNRTPKIALTKLTRIIDAFRIPPNGLLILDPVSWVAGGDLNKYDRVQAALGALSQLCWQRKITILGIAHTSKQRADPKENYKRTQDKILGSMALLGGTGTQMGLEGPDQTGEDGIYRFAWTPHHAIAESYRLTRTANGLFATDDISSPVEVDATLPRADLLALVPADGEGEGITPLQLARAMQAAHIEPLSVRQIARLLAQWQELGVLRPSGRKRGFYFRLKPA